MESGKLDIDNEAKGLQEPVATYKPIPEDDSVLLAKELVKEELKMAKRNGDTDIEDGAQELMLKDTSKINSNKEAGEVKFIAENGDAKIDIETVKQTLTGMTKEELMKFANDPFWIRLRWFMFVAFWLLWAAMLAGAIAIIVMAPKCTAPEPKKSWQKSPIVRLDPSTQPAGIKEPTAILDRLRSKNIKVISVGPIVDTDSNGHTTDFLTIRPNFGTMEDFEKLVAAAKERDQEIILELDPNYTSDQHPWFKDSVQRIDPFTDYYVWNKGKAGQTEPNNWRNVYDGSAWEWNEERGEFYLHQFNKTEPDLNYDNQHVVKEFSNILGHWIKLGVRGFRLAHTQYLLENVADGDEEFGTGAVTEESYKTLNHVRTFNLNANKALLEEWRKAVANNTEKMGLFTLQEDTANDVLELFNDNSTLVDLPQRSQFLYNADGNISASAIQAGVNNNLPSNKESWPAWNLNGQHESLQTRMSADVAESLTLMTLLLPGTPILSIAQTEYPGDAFAALVKAREEPAFLHGKTKTDVTADGVFIYTRLKHGNPGYLVAYHSGNQSVDLDLSKVDSVSDEVTVIALSSNYHQEGISVKSRIPSTKVPISPKSTMVVQFAPK